MGTVVGCFQPKRMPSDFKKKINWPPVLQRCNSQSAPKQTHNAFYSDFKPFWLFFKLMGFFPYHLDKNRDMKFQWLSKEMLYSIIVYAALCVPVLSVLYHRWQQWLVSVGDFNRELHVYMLAVLMVPHIIIPSTHWLELRRFEAIFKTWRMFQVSYEDLLNVNLRMPLRFGGYKPPIFVIFFSCFAVISSYFSSESANIRDLMAHFYVYSIFVFHVMLIIGLSCRMTTLSKDLRSRLALAIKSEDATYVRQFMGLWMNLSKSAQVVATLFYRMHGHLFCVVFAITTITLYGVLKMLGRGIIRQRMLYLIAGLINNNLWIFLVCETAERLTLEVGHKYILLIGRLRPFVRNTELRSELDSFVTMITANPPIVTLRNFVIINRSLFITINATMVTYLIVVLQFSQDNFTISGVKYGMSITPRQVSCVLIGEVDRQIGKMAVTVLDGGFSTQLSKYVGDVIDGDPLWSARFLSTNPQAVFNTHLDFLNAGAEVIITNSYQASVDGFKEYLGLDRKASLNLIKESARLAQRARDHYMRENPSDRKPLIAGSVGSYGASLHDGSEYTGCFIHETSVDTIREWHRPRINALLEAGVDLLAIETIPVIEEAIALLDLLKEFPNARAWLSFQCKDGEKTAHGDLFSDVVEICWTKSSDQLLAIGCNCLNPKFITPLMSSVRSSEIPLVVYPNSGEHYSPDLGWTGTAEKPNLGAYVDEWLNLGVKYVGGCCRTDAADVKIIRKAVKNWLLINA